MVYPVICPIICPGLSPLPPHFRPNRPAILTGKETTMACILTLAGNIAGFLVALAAVLLFDIPLGMGILIWCGTGLATLAGGLAIAQAPRTDAEPSPVQELA
jgi:hypothetical protein